MNSITNFFRNVLAVRTQALILSAIVLLVCVGGIVYQGGLLYGIDFTGGLRILLAFDEPLGPEEIRRVRGVFTDDFASAQVQTVSLQGEDQRRGVMVVVRAKGFVDRLTNQLYQAGQAGSRTPFENIKGVGPNSIIDVETLEREFSLGGENDAGMDLTQASRNEIQSSVQSIVNQVLSNRVLDLLRQELVAADGEIDLNWASQEEVQAWLARQQAQGLVKNIIELRSAGRLNTGSLDQLLSQFPVTQEAFSRFFRLGEEGSGEFNLRTIPEENLRNIVFEEFFRNEFTNVAGKIISNRSNRGLYRSEKEVLNLPALDSLYKPVLKQSFYLSPFIIKSREMISPSIGAELVTQVALAILLSMIGIIIYLYIRFELTYSFGAIAAIVHDVLITVGLITILGVEFSVPVVASILTVIGYSLNDTIVNFDRIRENRVLMGHDAEWFDVVNRSVEEVLNRTFVTSITTFIAALVLYVYGGISLNGFAITLLIGVVAGTYSSIFVSNVVFFELKKRFG